MIESRVPGISGTLVSRWYLQHRLGVDFAGRLGESSVSAASRGFSAWWRRAGAHLGPASGVRTVCGAGAAPLLEILGFQAGVPHVASDGESAFILATADRLRLPVVVCGWGWSLNPYFSRTAARGGDGAAWAAGFNGRIFRLWHIARGWSRAYTDFDLETLAVHHGAFAAFWALARSEALDRLTPRIVEQSARHGRNVRAALRDGVRDALELLLSAFVAAGGPARFDRPQLDQAYGQALTVVYRVLFLLFAESRGLVPIWHPIYRRAYAIETLRDAAEQPGHHVGLWQALQAAARLAHAGCRAGDLVVHAFNGRLFAPGRTPLARARHVDDALVARALVAMTTTPARGGRDRIAFNDLGVEQLGAVYESVLDYEPVGGGPATAAPRVTLAGTGARRKMSGTFYTPRQITDYVVRQALDPLLEGASPEQILDLRVLDPAMGSGALLVAACGHLAAAYEAALVRDHGRLPGDITDEERAGFRRAVARRCLYGVDINPMAVQVARLSLWLATMAADRPLTFLDHHLAVGNSLVGASPADLIRRPPGGARPRRIPATLPLFLGRDHEDLMAPVLSARQRMAAQPDDDVTVVRDKELALARTRAAAGPLARAQQQADLWCSGWFWQDAAGTPTRGEFGELAAAAAGSGTTLPAARIAARLSQVRQVARTNGFFHWPLEFPEVFSGPAGSPDTRAGFDAVITNPPWEMVRADTGPVAARAPARRRLAGLVRFVRESGVYSACATGHANLYQFFVERCLRLARPGGRVGLVVPWGLASDHGAAALRHLLLDRCDTDVLVGLDNAAGVFPIHRGVRFLLVSSSPGAPTRQTRCYFGHRDPAILDRLAAEPGDQDPRAAPVCVTPSLLARLGGPSRAFPYARGPADLALADRLARVHPSLGSADGWGARPGRELNATDDRGLMGPDGDGLLVIEGKHLEPFRLRCDRLTMRIRPGARLPEAIARASATWRLAYRDVAAASNALTLIAAPVPPGHVMVHTSFCVRAGGTRDEQACLCALLNSFVANYLVRLWVTTHVSAATLVRIPVPRPGPGTALFGQLRDLALALAADDPGRSDCYPLVQAAAARAYGLTTAEFEHVLESFPLAEPTVRSRALALFEAATGACPPASKPATLSASVRPPFERPATAPCRQGAGRALPGGRREGDRR